MDALRYILRKVDFTNRIDAGAGAKNANASPLLRLPPEMILLVASMLPAPYAACLALCNRRTYRMLGHQFFMSLKGEAPDALLVFLSSLAKDLPQRFVCQECARLHRINAIDWPRTIIPRGGLACIWKSPGYCLLFLSGFRIHLPHVQLAMKQHLCGTDIGFPLEAFRHLEVEHHQAKQKITLLSVDAQIVSNELLMRSQTWTLLPWSEHDMFFDKLAQNRLYNEVCIHTRLGHWEENSVSKLVRSRLDQLVAREKCHAQTLHCSHCWMDFVLDVVDFGERGIALLVTRWANLGAGLDVEDAKWNSHINIRMAKGVHHPHQRGSIRKAFEEHEDLSVEDFTADNQHKLLSRRQNRLLHRGSDGFDWKWDHDQRWYLAPSGPPEMSFWEFLGPRRR